MKPFLLFIAIIMSMTAMGAAPLSKDSISQSKSPESVDKVYTKVDQMPQFQDQSCMTFPQWVRANMVYPDEAKERSVEGTVVASFIVDTLGDVTNIQIIREVDPALAKATIELLNKSPRWVPGEENGVKRRVRFVIPINYKFTYSNSNE